MKSIRGHTDIVRDVAWHPTRNEILTSSWDYHLNINTYQSPKRAPHKRFNRDTESDTQNGEEGHDGPPPRRSRRIAELQENIAMASASGSSGHGSHQEQENC